MGGGVAARRVRGPFVPLVRALTVAADGRLEGHASAFLIPSRPALRVFGVGDLVVASGRRGTGIGAALAAATVAECERREAQVILVDTLAARSLFTALGFASVPAWTVYYQRDAACHRHEHWMIRAAVPPPRVELLAHGDF